LQDRLTRAEPFAGWDRSQPATNQVDQYLMTVDLIGRPSKTTASARHATWGAFDLGIFETAAPIPEWVQAAATLPIASTFPRAIYDSS
jgi:hypothetical protein